MKELNINYKLSEKEYTDIQIYFLMRRSNIVKFCAALFVIGIVLGVIELITGSGISGVWLLVAFPVPYLMYIYWKMKNIAVRMYKGDIKVWDVTMNDEGITTVAVQQKKTNFVDWQCVVRKWNTKKYIYIFVSKKVYIAIPKRSIESEEDMKCLYQYLGFKYEEKNKENVSV